MIRVVIADKHDLIRKAFRTLLQREPDIRLVGEAEGGPDAVDLAMLVQPDVVTLDLQLPHLNGLEAAQRIRERPAGTKVLLVALELEDEYVRQALTCGASGYVAKFDAGRELIPAIREVYQGGRYFSDRLAAWRSRGALSGLQVKVV